MPSTVIRSIAYRPAEAAAAFRAARIKGPYFNHHIRGHYRYEERLDGD